MLFRSPEAFKWLKRGLERIVSVTEDEILDGIRILLKDTHNLAEGAGSAALAALLKEKDRHRGKRVAVVLSGGNADAALQLAEAEFARMVLSRGDRRYILTDSSKFGRRALLKVCDFSDIDCLISEAAPPADIAVVLAAANLRCEVA